MSRRGRQHAGGKSSLHQCIEHVGRAARSEEHHVLVRCPAEVVEKQQGCEVCISAHAASSECFTLEVADLLDLRASMYGEVEPSKYGAKNGNVRTLRRGHNGCRAAHLRNIDRATEHRLDWSSAGDVNQLRIETILLE